MEQSTDKTDVRMKSTRRTFLSAGAVAAAAVTAGPLIAGPAFASSGGAAPGPGGPLHAQKPDRELRTLLAEIDHRRLEATVNRLVAFGTRHTASSQTDPVRGIGAATIWVTQQMQASAAASGGRMTVETQTFTQPVSPQIPVPTQITNIITTLRGDVTPDRIYVVTAHLDSRVTNVLNFTDDAPGADDDGSGVAVLIELTRLMATRHFEATIVFGIVAGEEQGIYGSAFMAQQMKAAGADIQAMFSNDIVGASSAFDGTKPDPHTLRLFVEGVPTSETPNQTALRQAVGGENDGPSRQLGRFVSSVADNSDTDMHIRVIWRRDRYLRGSDHISFLDQGYPAARFTEPRENFDHEHNDVGVVDGVQHGDLAEFCDFEYMARVAKVNATTLWSLAQAPGTPKNSLLLTESLTNLSTLSWDRGSEPDLAGYEVVWRETTDPDWTNVISVGDVTTVTIDLSKDNVFFGVRAVDQGGHRSPVASPQPG